MPLFTSDRERRLWLCSLAVVVAIYSTLGLAGTLAEVLRERNLLPASLLFLLFLLVAAIVGSGLKRRPGRREVWVALGVTAVYGMTVLRMSSSPEERTHLFEYGIVTVLIYQALSERAQNGRRVRAPARSRPGRDRPVGLARRGHPGAPAEPRLRQLRRLRQRAVRPDGDRGERGNCVGAPADRRAWLVPVADAVRPLCRPRLNPPPASSAGTRRPSLPPGRWPARPASSRPRTRRR